MRLTHFTHVLLALLLLAAAFGAYGLSYHIVDQKTADAAAAQSEIESKALEAAQDRQAQNQLAGLEADEAQVSSYFVQTRDVVPFLTAIEATGHTFGTKVSVVSVSDAPGTPHGHLTISVSVTGPFDSVLRTVGALEYAPYDISLSNLTLDTTDASKGSASDWSAAATFVVGTSDTPAPKAATVAPVKAATSTTATSSTATTTP